MPQRNGYKGNGGRSAVARKVRFGGPSGTNGIMPSVIVMTQNGPIRTSYFGGPKKGGAAPSATGFMTVTNPGANYIASPALNPRYVSNYRQMYSLGYPGAGGPNLG